MIYLQFQTLDRQFFFLHLIHSQSPYIGILNHQPRLQEAPPKLHPLLVQTQAAPEQSALSMAFSSSPISFEVIPAGISVS